MSKKRNRFPDWLRKKHAVNDNVITTQKILNEFNLNSVCQSARCPNQGECFARKTATFMIMGNICTRNCRFCAVKKGQPEQLSAEEPVQLARAVEKLELKHVVITSVTRDDLEDGGAGHFVSCIEEIRKLTPEVTIEVLPSDFKGNKNAINKLITARPDIFNHNLETVPALYDKVRPEAEYGRSLMVLSYVNEIGDTIFTKSGIMVGLGEKEEEVIKLMEDLRKANCDILTIGQYLQPSKNHLPVVEFIKPEQFAKYKKRAEEMGFQYVASGPFVRSSYHADEFWNNN